MIRALGVLLLLVFAVLAAACEQLSESLSGAQNVLLAAAIDEGLVEARFEATGQASGDVIILRIRRLESRELSVSVPGATVLQNPSAGEQDMVIRQLKGRVEDGGTYLPAKTAVLVNDDWVEYVIEAYCLEAHRDNPGAGGSLSLAGPAPADVQAVLAAIDDVPEAEGNIRVIQAAIWAVTDDISIAELASVGYRLSSDDVAAARDLIRGAGLNSGDYRLSQGS